MIKFFAQIIASIATLFVAHHYLPGVLFKGDFSTLLVAGTTLGFLNFFIKPLLKIITLPLRILTFGLFSLIINIAIVYLVDLAFYELIFEGFYPLILFTILLWGINLILYSFLK